MWPYSTPCYALWNGVYGSHLLLISFIKAISSTDSSLKYKGESNNNAYCHQLFFTHLKTSSWSLLVGPQVPIVASTGGLVDTVQDGVNGFHIGRAFNINVWSPLLFPTEIITKIAYHVINSRCFRSLSATKEAGRERDAANLTAQKAVLLS